MVLPNKEQASKPGANTPSHALERFHSASVFKNLNDFYNHALDTICTGVHHEDIVYTQVPRDWAESVLKQLDKETEHTCARKNYNLVTQTLWIRKMPTRIHDCHQRWIKNEMGRWLQSGLLTIAEWDNLSPSVGTIIDFVYGPYVGSRKEPDLLIQPDNEPLPTFVIESGWSESLPRLHDDMNLWLVGGNGKVKATIILNWRRVENTTKVRGTAEFYTPDANSIPILRQEETIFPISQQAQAQVIRLTRRILFGSTVFPGRNANDVFILSLDILREVATDALDLMGLVPA